MLYHSKQSSPHVTVSPDPFGKKPGMQGLFADLQEITAGLEAQPAGFQSLCSPSSCHMEEGHKPICFMPPGTERKTSPKAQLLDYPALFFPFPWRRPRNEERLLTASPKQAIPPNSPEFFQRHVLFQH